MPTHQPTHQPTTAPANPHYERLGGQAAVQRLVDAFYRAMDTRADAQVIRAMHEADLAHTRSVLVLYLGEWLGGPKAYSAARGAPMLRRRHHAFDIDASARDAWMACMRQALAETCSDAALRADLEAAFYKVADFIRNTVPNTVPNTASGGPAATDPVSPTRSAP